jgi:hypothetical protein
MRRIVMRAIVCTAGRPMSSRPTVARAPLCFVLGGLCDAVMLFTSLTFSLLAQPPTFPAALKRELANPAGRRRHFAFVVDRLQDLVCNDQAARGR